MPAVERLAAEVERPVLPGIEQAATGKQPTARAPQCKQRSRYLFPGLAIGVVEDAIAADARAIVFAGGVNHGGGAENFAIGGPRPRREGPRRAPPGLHRMIDEEGPVLALHRF